MSFLDKLAFTTVQKTATRVTVSPMDRARNKMINALILQQAIAEAEAKGEKYIITKTKRDGTVTERSPRKWWYMVGDTVYMDLRYGNRLLDVGGKSTVEVGSAENIIPTINIITDAVKAGELDKQILAISETSGRGKKTGSPCC